VEGWQTIRTKEPCVRQAGGLARRLVTKKKRKVLDTANKRRNTSACFEVGYVSSSFLHGAEHWYSAPLR
jgi:hypothetical protein